MISNILLYLSNEVAGTSSSFSTTNKEFLDSFRCSIRVFEPYPPSEITPIFSKKSVCMVDVTNSKMLHQTSLQQRVALLLRDGVVLPLFLC